MAMCKNDVALAGVVPLSTRIPHLAPPNAPTSPVLCSASCVSGVGRSHVETGVCWARMRMLGAISCGLYEKNPQTEPRAQETEYCANKVKPSLGGYQECVGS